MTSTQVSLHLKHELAYELGKKLFLCHEIVLLVPEKSNFQPSVQKKNLQRAHDIKGTGITKREKNTGSRLFTEVKPCWMRLISGWVTISIKYPVLYSLGSQAGVVDTNHAFHLYYNVVCGSSFSRSQPDFEGFLRALLV